MNGFIKQKININNLYIFMINSLYKYTRFNSNNYSNNYIKIKVKKHIFNIFNGLF